jgi:hypothetical protein
MQGKGRQRGHMSCSLQKHNLELSKLVGMVTGGAPSVIGSTNCMVSLLKTDICAS